MAEKSQRGLPVATRETLMTQLVNHLIDSVEAPNQNVREDALEELVFLLKSQDEDKAISIKARDALIKLGAFTQNLSIKKKIDAALSYYPSPNNRFSSLKSFTSLRSKYWHPDSTYPDTVGVPAGPFLMGSDEHTGFPLPVMRRTDGSEMKIDEFASESFARLLQTNPSSDIISYRDERPLHSIYLETFEIGVVPVTNSQYRLFVDENKYSSPNHWVNGGIPIGLDDYPVVNVTWFDAIAYCNWLSEKWRKIKRIKSNDEVRLPSEAEWEKAARGNDGRLFPWGNVFDPTLCNHVVAGIGNLTPVGFFAPSADSRYGCKDMAGNVWDWTLSSWGAGGHQPYFGYPYDPSDGRESSIADGRVRRVIRGGAFYYYIDCLRCSVRNRSYPFSKHPAGSFRIAVARKNLDPLASAWLDKKL